MSGLTIELGTIVARCKACGTRHELSEKLRVIDPETDAILDAIEVDIDGPCPSCPGGDGGDELPEVTAAE